MGNWGIGFILGIDHKVRAITKKGRNARRLVQGGKRERVTVIETVCADGTVLMPLIIWKAQIHTVGMCSGLEDKYNTSVAFTTSRKGYTNNRNTFEYLEKICIPKTVEKYFRPFIYNTPVNIYAEQLGLVNLVWLLWMAMPQSYSRVHYLRTHT